MSVISYWVPVSFFFISQYSASTQQKCVWLYVSGFKNEVSLCVFVVRNTTHVHPGPPLCPSGFLVFINLYAVKYGAIALQEIFDSIQPK